jgi:hypothetical protein
MTYRPSAAEMAAAVTELRVLRTALTDLVLWADTRLSQTYDRQYIAEHLTDAVLALVDGDTPPDYPF